MSEEQTPVHASTKDRKQEGDSWNEKVGKNILNSLNEPFRKFNTADPRVPSNPPSCFDQNPYWQVNHHFLVLRLQDYSKCKGCSERSKSNCIK